MADGGRKIDNGSDQPLIENQDGTLSLNPGWDGDVDKGWWTGHVIASNARGSGQAKNFKPPNFDNSVKFNRNKTSQTASLKKANPSGYDAASSLPVDNWIIMDWREIYDRSTKLEDGPLTVLADEWNKLVSDIGHAYMDIQKAMNGHKGDWKGLDQQAVSDAADAFANLGPPTTEAITGMGSLNQFLGDSFHNFKGTVVTPDDIRSQYQKWLESVSKENLEHYNQDAFQKALDAIENQATIINRGLMGTHYQPAVDQANVNVPAFEQGKPVGPPPNVETPGGSGGGGTDGGGGAGGGGAPDIPSTPGMPNMLSQGDPADDHSNAASPDQLTGGIRNALSSGMQQTSQMGQQVLSAAQQQAQRAAMDLTRGLTPAGLPAAFPAMKPGGGGAPKGGGGGGIGSGAGQGATKPSLTTRPVSMKPGAKAAPDEGLSARPSTQTQTSGSGTTGGTTGGAGRGAGATSDKVHKANKNLHTTKNGKALLGGPPLATPAVVKPTVATDT